MYRISGAIIQSTLDDEQAKTHAVALSDLSVKASHIVGLLNPDDELTFLRIRSKTREIMVSFNNISVSFCTGVLLTSQILLQM